MIQISMRSQDYYEFGDVAFSYQVTGVRDGFENEQVIVDAEDINSGIAVEQGRNAVKDRIKANMDKAKTKRHSKDR